MAGDERAGILGQEVNRSLGGELLADHGGPGDHGALARPETIQPRRQQRRDRRWDRELGLVATSFCEHGDELLDEEGVSIGGLEHADPCGLGETSSEVGDQRLAVRVRKALEQERARVRLSAAPAGSLLEELGTGDANQEDRRTPHPLRQVLDQVEEGGLGPVHVLEEDDEGPLPGERFEQASGGPEDFLAIARRLRDADRLLEAVGERPRLVSIGEELSGRAGGRELADYFAQRPEGDALPVRHAAANENGGLFGGERGELLREPRFPDPRRPEDREQVQRALASRVLERLPELGKLGLAADERRLQRSNGGPFAREVTKPPGGARFGLDRLGPGASANEPLGLLAEEDLPGGCGVHELSRRGHRFADDRHHAGAGTARQDLAGRDSDAGRCAGVDRVRESGRPGSRAPQTRPGTRRPRGPAEPRRRRSPSCRGCSRSFRRSAPRSARGLRGSVRPRC